MELATEWYGKLAQGLSKSRRGEDGVPRTVRLRLVEEPPAGTRYIIDLSGEAYLDGLWITSKSPGLLQQTCGGCEKIIVRGRPHLKRDDAGNPIVLRCAHCRAYNEMLQE